MSVTAPQGFTAAAVAAGIKKGEGPDLALVAATEEVAAAGLFTRNRAAAAPVLLSRHQLRTGRARAVVLNSGCANAGTGARGEADARLMTESVGTALGCDPRSVVVCSTGPIGTHLPRQKVQEGIARAASDLAGDEAAGAAAAAAILTTDTVAKQAVREGDGYRLGGMAKGAGMIRPDMATLLVLVTTDAVMTPAALDRSLRTATDVSFNSLDLDGAPSTNDTIVLLASAASGRRPDPEEFQAQLTSLCADLAAQVAHDGEGSTRVVTVAVRGAENDAIARQIARTIADSGLVRASFYGADPNWGRVLAAVGAGRYPVNPTMVTISYAGIEVARNSAPVDHDREAVVERLQGDFVLEVEVGDGPGRAAVLTNDLTPEYVQLNAEYS